MKCNIVITAGADFISIQTVRLFVDKYPEYNIINLDIHTCACNQLTPDRIVSVSKPYIRPIVKGKETKSVKFGANCNNILIDGISFIEKFSFKAFNEGISLKHSVFLAQKLTGVGVKKIG